MNKNIRDFLFILICFSLPFIYLPEEFQFFNFLSGSMSSKLMFYPSIAFIIYIFYCHLRYGKILVRIREFTRYSAILLGIITVSYLSGLITYPYYDWIGNAPYSHIVKLNYIVNWFMQHDYYIDSTKIVITYFSLSVFKNILLDYLWTFVLSYSIYCGFYKNFSEAISCFYRGSLSSLLVVCIYGFMDVAYLGHFKWAKEALIILNPFIHSIEIHHGWYPPLLIPNQLRSIFTEPSFIGNYISYVIPVLWCNFLFSDKIKLSYIVTYCILSFFVVLTQARTSMAMYFGILFLFFMLILFLRKKEYIKKFAVILICSAFTFVLGSMFIERVILMNYNNLDSSSNISANNEMEIVTVSATSSLNNLKLDLESKKDSEKNIIVHDKKEYEQKNNEIIEGTKKILDDNLMSLTKSKGRSNEARYALYKSSLRAFYDNPILGVGKGLSGAYIIDKFTENEKKNYEVSLWCNDFFTQGIFKANINAMNEYIVGLTELGVIGFSIYIIPFLFPVLYFIKKIRSILECKIESIVMLLTSTISLLVVSINGGFTFFHYIWIILALDYLAIDNLKSDIVKSKT